MTSLRANNNDNFSEAHLPFEHLRFFYNSEGGLLVNQAHNVLYALDPTSTLALLLLTEQRNKDQGHIVQQMISLGINESDALASLQCLDEHLKNRTSLQSFKQQHFSFTTNRIPLIANNRDIGIFVAHQSFLISCPDPELRQTISNLLSPVQCGPRERGFKLEVIKVTDCYQLKANGEIASQQLSKAELLPELIDLIQIIAFQSSHYDFCFHGASLRKGSLTLWLPGVSGSGKSTLTYLLAQKGWHVYSDEMLTVSNCKTLPIELPIALKSGSLDFVADDNVTFHTQTPSKRIDGRAVKYIWPPSLAEAKEHRRLIVLFPTFVNKQTLSISHISPLKAFTSLLNCGYQYAHELNNVDPILDLLSLLTASRCVTATYGDALDVVSWLENQVASDGV